MKSIRITGCILLLINAGFLAAQDTVKVGYYYRQHFIFNSGFWVFLDSTTNLKDSITLESVTHGYYGPNPVMTDYHEFYKIQYYSHTNDSSYNDFFWDYLWRINGGGEWAELGQPVMMLGPPHWTPILGGFNGFEVLAILDSLLVGDIVYSNVIWSRVYEAQQYQHVFYFDTDLFYAENIGLVREEYTDNNDIHHVWNLVNWEGNLITGEVYRNDFKKPNFYPNPFTAAITIEYTLSKPSTVQLFIYDFLGRLVDKKELNQGQGKQRFVWNAEGLPAGVYSCILKTDDGMQMDKLIKH